MQLKRKEYNTNTEKQTQNCQLLESKEKVLWTPNKTTTPPEKDIRSSSDFSIMVLYINNILIPTKRKCEP